MRTFSDALMPPKRVRRILATFVVLNIIPGLGLGLLTWTWMRWDTPGPLGVAICVRDYLNLWAAGSLSRLDAVATLFQPTQYDAWLRSVFGEGLPVHTWSYPPAAVFLAIPISLLPIVPGFLVWGTGTLGVLWVVLKNCRIGPWACVAVLVSPAAIENALVGQNGALTAALLEGGLLLVDRLPGLAGVLFGLLTMKPQLGLLVPVCLLASARWRTIGTCLVTSVLLGVSSAAAFGLSSWVAYLGDVRRFMTSQVLEQPFGAAFQHLVATPFILVRSLDGSLTLAYGMQAMVTIGSAVVTWRAWRRPNADPKARMALTAALSLLATPYAYSYDTLGTAIGVASLAEMAAQTGFLPLEAVLLAAAWCWPGWAFWLGNAGFPPIGCLVFAGLAVCAWRRL